MLRTLTAVHRWLGLLIGLQLIAWSVGGLYFAAHPIDVIHGDTLRKTPAVAAIDGDSLRLPSFKAGQKIDGAKLVFRGGVPVWELREGKVTRLVDAKSGVDLAALSEAEARAIVLADYAGSGSLAKAQLVESDAPLEYRDKPLPAWLIEISDADSTHVYVDARTGGITAYRTASWRRWDFLWMLHIMDYKNREESHNPILFCAAILALVTTASGLLLWAGRVSHRWIRRRSDA